MTYNQIVSSLHELSGEELRSLNTAVVSQLKANRKLEDAKAMRVVKVGDKGVTTGLRASQNGERCEVVELRQSKIVVSMTDYIPTKRYVIPASCFQVSQEASGA